MVPFAANMLKYATIGPAIQRKNEALPIRVLGCSLGKTTLTAV
jgi:hypothetical protein